jgi:hypothetical protein
MCELHNEDDMVYSYCKEETQHVYASPRRRRLQRVYNKLFRSSRTPMFSDVSRHSSYKLGQPQSLVPHVPAQPDSIFTERSDVLVKLAKWNPST